tara:strand:- start:13 stop:480 length:468 start_codon:yes stop_codon:yes gene_type:complete
MDKLTCEICDQDFSNSIGLEKHINTNKHKTNKKLLELTNENEMIKEQKNSIANELSDTYETMENLQMKVDSDKYDIEHLHTKLDATLQRLDEISQMILSDIESLKIRNNKNISELENKIKSYQNKENKPTNGRNFIYGGIGIAIISILIKNFYNS